MPPKRKTTTNQKGHKKRKVITRSKKNYIASDDNTSRPFIQFTCSVCNDSFKTESELRDHLVDCKRTSLAVAFQTSASRPALKCSECNKVFKYKTNYHNHCKNEHAKNHGSVACSMCNARCPNKKVLVQHIQQTHNRDQYVCSHCKRTFVRRAHVLRHMAQSGCDGSEATTYPCEICPATFSRKDNLIVHLRHQHVLKKNYTCKHCPYTSKNFSKLVRHWQFYHLFPQLFECDICGKTTSSRTSMAKHLEIHGEKKQSCDVCGYKTFTAEVLKRHVLTHVKNKPHKCNLCGVSYIQRLQLLRHMAKHTGNICDQCGEAFPNKSRLLVHQRHHMGLDRLVCPVKDCNSSKKEFDNESSLHGHVKTHLASKDYKCEVCDKSFYSEVNMKRHVSTHRLDRPRRCMYCVTARAYIRGEQLLRHVRRLHPDLFRQHLAHVRRVLGTDINVNRVKKSEMESILNVLDAESDRIMDGYGGSDVLYGGVQEEPLPSKDAKQHIKVEYNPLMTEQELEENLKMLLQQLIHMDTLKCFGWPDESVDSVLEKVIEHCGAKSADPERWTRVQRLRENAKHLFLYAVEDKHIARMLDTHTIDQVVKHILTQVAQDQA